jgi:hypothetical protein
MYYHVFPLPAERTGRQCTCAWNHGLAADADVGM